MGRDRDVLAQIKDTRGERGQQFVERVVLNRHENSPNKLRSLFIARRDLDFTVPSGIRSIRAISP